MPNYKVSAFQSAAPRIGQAIGAWLNGPQAFDQGREDAIAGQTKLGALVAQMHAHESTARYNDARTETERAGLEAQSPGSLQRNAMLNNGVPLDEEGPVNNYLRTGQLGGKYAPAADGMGPVAAQPKWAGPADPEPGWGKPTGVAPGYDNKLGSIASSIGTMGNAIAIGEKDLKRVAEAQDINRLGQLREDSMAGRIDPMMFARTQAAVKGDPMFHSDGSGGVLDLYGGGLNTNNPLAKSTILQRTEQAGASRASATNSYASAGQHRAATDKLRTETGQLTEGLPEGIKPAAIDNAAARYNVDGTLPPLSMGKSGASIRTAILNRAAELADGTSGTDQRVNQLGNKGDTAALAQLTKQKTMVSAFEKNANLNADVALDLSNKLDRTGVPIFNRWIQAGRTGTGSVEAAQFNAANETFVSEYAKIMSGSMGNTAVSDAARKHAHDMLSTAMSQKQYSGVVSTLKQEMGNRMKGFDDQEVELRTRLRGGTPAPHAAPTAGPTAGTGPAAGTVDGGYRFKGGDASVQSNWEKVK